jgi:hypothetical protein
MTAFCGLVVRVSGYRSRGPGSVPGATREVVGLERGPLSLVSTIEELLGRKSSGSGLETENTAVGIRPRGTPLSAKVGTNFSEKRRCRTMYKNPNTLQVSVLA